MMRLMRLLERMPKGAHMIKHALGRGGARTFGMRRACCGISGTTGKTWAQVPFSYLQIQL